uniref:AsnC family transcriptional regulator n=1 Tax=Metallosphaera hakonensis TaxID=79601 RepID=UPI0006D1E8E2
PLDTDDDRVFVKFRCLENFNVYGIEADNLLELNRIIGDLSLTLGSPIMKYVPDQSPTPMKKNISKILSTLSENPRARIGEIALKLNYTTEKVRRTMLKMNEKAKIVPEVDLIKADSMLLGVFTKRLEEIKHVTEVCSVITIDSREGEGVEICFTGGIKESKDMVDQVRRIDRYAQIMLVYDFAIRGYKSFFLVID